MSLILPMLGNPGAVAGAGLVFEYLDTQNTSASDDPYTFTGVNLGAASSDRLIIVGCSWQRQDGGCTFSSGTIASVSATTHATGDDNMNNNEIGAALFSAVVSAGTSGTVVVDLGTTARGCQIDVWSLKNYDNATPVDTFGFNDRGVDSISDTINVSEGGVVIGHTGNKDNRTITWTGLTERSDNPSYDPNIGSSGADASELSAGTLFVEADTDADSNNRQALVLGSWR